MAVRPTAEMIANFKALMGENMSDEAVNFLEDLTDSTQQIDTANYVEKSQYDQITQERDRYKNQAEDACRQQDDICKIEVTRYAGIWKGFGKGTGGGGNQTASGKGS